MVLALAGNDKDMACKICHHKKRKGRDPRACRRCHGTRQVKAKGVDLCITGCHAKANRKDIDEVLKPLPRWVTRRGKLLKLKDAYHIRCKNCHAKLRGISLDLDATKYLAPVDYCEGCHVPIKEEDRKRVEAEREAERKMVPNSIELIKKAIKEGGE